MAVNIPGVIAIAFFYVLVLGTGIWASFKSKKKQKKYAASGIEMSLLGNRSINLVVGIFTMTGDGLFFLLLLFFVRFLISMCVSIINAISGSCCIHMN